ncbi:MAG: myo-inosose-2 dehydratase [Spirochaetales bacterium]|nr:myo-inosose-2 dehydratase [Spirochaetales bacterium]
MIDKSKIKLACAPINWTNDDAPELGGELTYQQCLSEMALAGYQGSEIGNKYPRDVKVLKKALALRNLEICNQWFSCFFTTRPEAFTIEKFIETRDFLHALGTKVIGVCEVGLSVQGDLEAPIYETTPTLTDEQFKKIAAGVEKLGELAKEKGMTVAYHHHMGTGIQTLEQFNKLMDMTNPDLVKALLDTGHFTYAGEDAVEGFRKHIDRCVHIHLKDLRRSVWNEVGPKRYSYVGSVIEGVFTVPGDGDLVDWDGVFDVIKNSNFEGWIVLEAEQDPAIYDPLEYAQNARAFINEKLGL